MNEIGRRRVGAYVGCLVRDWLRKGWVENGNPVGTLVLTKDGTEQITKVNVGRRGTIIFAQGPVSERGRLKFVSTLCWTVIGLGFILSVTVLLSDVIAIAIGANVVKTFTNPTKILRKPPYV